MGQYLRPTIYNKTMTLANTEYSQAIADETRKLQISCRGAVDDIKLAFASGQSGITYITIPAGSTYTIENTFFEPSTILYIQSPTAGAIAEILAFV